VDYGVKA